MKFGTPYPFITINKRKQFMLLVHLVIQLLEQLLKKNAQFSIFSWCYLI